MCCTLGPHTSYSDNFLLLRLDKTGRGRWLPLPEPGSTRGFFHLKGGGVPFHCRQLLAHGRVTLLLGFSLYYYTVFPLTVLRRLLFSFQALQIKLNLNNCVKIAEEPVTGLGLTVICHVGMKSALCRTLSKIFCSWGLIKELSEEKKPLSEKSCEDI